MTSVQQFVQDQQCYANYYAKVGERDRLRTPDASIPSPSRTTLLKTPVLIARVPAAKGNDRGTRKETSSKACSSQQKIRQKKGIDTHDKEQSKRLLERSQRRREKRAILQGIHLYRDGHPPSGKEKNQIDAQGDKKRKGDQVHKSHKGSKLPLGIALMESFITKSTKRDRLTLRPNASKGVFNRGRASMQTKPFSTKVKVKIGRDWTFKESEFLNRSGRVNSQLSANSSQMSGEASSLPLPVKLRDLKKSAYFNKQYPEETEEKSRESPVATTTNTKRSRVYRERSSSPIWDIERGQDLPEDVRSVGTQSTTDLDKLVLQRESSREVQPRGSDRPLSPGPSLRPSQSASQMVSGLQDLCMINQSVEAQRLIDPTSRFPCPRATSPSLTVLERAAYDLVPRNIWVSMSTSPIILSPESLWEVGSERDSRHEVDMEDTDLRYSGYSNHHADIYDRDYGFDDYDQTSTHSRIDLNFEHEDEYVYGAKKSDRTETQMVGEQIDENLESEDNFCLELYQPTEVICEEKEIGYYRNTSLDEELSEVSLTSFDSNSPPRLLYTEGRALLAGWRTVEHVNANMGKSGLTIEREIAAVLKDHWRPQRL